MFSSGVRGPAVRVLSAVRGFGVAALCAVVLLAAVPVAAEPPSGTERPYGDGRGEGVLEPGYGDGRGEPGPRRSEPEYGQTEYPDDFFTETGRPYRPFYDAAVLRPAALVLLGAGVLGFGVFYPVSLLTGGSDHVLEACITNPYERLTRPLGEL